MAEFPLAFLGMFEALRMGPTFARGRRDERAGHVRSLTVSGSLVVALVRGPEDPVAFRARIAVRAFGASEWARVETALVAEARFVADLLDGRMPGGIEAVFAEAGLSLLPLSLDEVAMDCTCERWPMPCAHLATTCYALARAFEADPFEVFTWRGRPRDELLMRLRRLREAAAVDAIGPGAAARESSTGIAGAGTSTPAGGAAGHVGAAGGLAGTFGPAGGVAGTFDPVGGAAGSGLDGGAASGSGSVGGRAKNSDVAGSAGAVWAAAADPVAFWGRPDSGETGPVAEPSGRASGGPGLDGRGPGESEAGGRGPDGREPGESEASGRGLDGRGPGESEAGGRGPDGRGPGEFGASGRGADGPGASGRGVSGAGTGERDGGLRPDALLDQLDAPGLSHHGRAIVEVLRPAYRALPDGEGADFATE
ncbi:hypothetical protein GCM10010112_21280 [Actinoplanes lobatus]|uniref:Putative Zn finger protein n=1 Tax=Actinoplanes lobatus TaxID=113568 RepID=A0A7W7MLC0_9ACTN|nr:hypothetical protein [Actinoplanes lobatus]MBB4754383.1 putative Zn finger protein [Actinoplanes lobatus]GGN62751.1 hypothetical protein GCM10010112_21280 [Actinoplanes lobatus]GIE40538.1 hypothetical protein Alo02nite_34360 [Actinoplanes lobatus]